MNLAWSQFVTDLVSETVQTAQLAQSASILVAPTLVSRAAPGAAAELEAVANLRWQGELAAQRLRSVVSPTKARIAVGPTRAISRVVARLAFIPGLIVISGLFLASVLAQNTLLNFASGMLEATRLRERQKEDDEEDDKEDPCVNCVLRGELPQDSTRRYVSNRRRVRV